MSYLSGLNLNINQLNKTGVVDKQNSTEDVLISTGTFTGIYYNVQSYSNISVYCKTDQDGVLYIDQSTDGFTLDTVRQYTITASTASIHIIPVITKYIRVRVNNTSGSTQSYLHLQTILNTNNTLPTTISPSTTINSESDCTLTRTILVAQAPDGSYKNVQCDASGYLIIAP